MNIKFRRIFTIILLCTFTLISIGRGTNKVVGAEEVKTITIGKGSYSTEVRGTWQYESNGTIITKENSELLNTLPYEGSDRRHTTDNYTGPVDTSDWATSVLWDYQGSEPYSHTTYAIPLAFKASAEGMMITSPSTIVDNNNNTYLMFMPEDGSLTDFVVSPEFSTKDAKVDKVTDWTYDVVMENSSNSSQYMKITMVQGSPFGYFQLSNSNKVKVVRKRTGLPSEIVYYNNEKLENSNILIVRTFDNQDQSVGYPEYDYYAIYAPEGTTWNISKTDTHINYLEANLPSDREYFSIATLGSTDGIDDEFAISVSNVYEKYAYNFILDTKAEYVYNEESSILKTTYSYIVERKAESQADGTIIGVLPHQYKNMKNTNFLDYEYRTIRGNMKVFEGSSFETELKFNGVLPFLPNIEESNKDIIKSYLDEYMNEYKDNYLAISEGSGDTYWTGKALNRVSNLLSIAEMYGTDEQKELLYNALKSELEDWFTTDDKETEKYFYYDEGIGSLFGFPQSYGSVDQINDHHFHYGYYIYSAAQIALRDKEWAEDSNYGAMVKELINDIACNDRDSSRYPYLRNFSPYEGHSWASGHQAFADGNNQESSSEALNAWAGIILFGEATGNNELRDLGIYLYTTEISAVNNYWFDVDEDVIDDRYRYNKTDINSIDKENDSIFRNQASMVWGGKYTYSTWWTAEPLQVQGINLLPMNPASFYLASNKDYIIKNLELALYHENNYSGSDKLSNPSDRWNDIWSAYVALADPDYAIKYWNVNADEELGETKAHTYNYIMSLKKYGTPDTSITSNCTMSAVFNKNGIYTYSAYNSTDEIKNVKFSDGTEISVSPNSFYVGDKNNNNYIENDIWTPVDPAPDPTPDPEPDQEPDLEPDLDPIEDRGLIIEGNKLSFFAKDISKDEEGVIVFYEIYDTKTQAEERAELVYPDGIPGYNMSYENDSWKVTLENSNIEDGKYILYKFNIVGKGLSEWVIEQIGEDNLTEDTVKEIEVNKDSVIFNVTDVDSNAAGVIAFYKVYNNKLEAEERAKIIYPDGIPGYNMSYNGNYWTVSNKDTSLENGKYILYKFNIVEKGLTDWKIIEITGI